MYSLVAFTLMKSSSLFWFVSSIIHLRYDSLLFGLADHLLQSDLSPMLDIHVLRAVLVATIVGKLLTYLG